MNSRQNRPRTLPVRILIGTMRVLGTAVTVFLAAMSAIGGSSKGNAPLLPPDAPRPPGNDGYRP
jgi:hypothetical protein